MSEKFMDPDKVRFRAECHTCPYRINPDWGHQEPTSAFEHSDEGAVKRWAENHVKLSAYMHYVEVSRVIRFPINVELLNKRIIDLLTGDK